MPFNWTVERERQMLLLAIGEANLRPTQETWAIVAKHLGEGITPSAVRCVGVEPIVCKISITTLSILCLLCSVLLLRLHPQLGFLKSKHR